MNRTVKGTLGPKTSMTYDLHLHHFNFNDSTANLFRLQMTVGKISTAEYRLLFNEESAGGSQTIRAPAGEETKASNWHLFDLHCFVQITQTL